AYILVNKNKGCFKMEEILRLFPIRHSHRLRKYIGISWEDLQEIRLRVNSPIELNFSNRIEWIQTAMFTIDDRDYLVGQLSEHSLYRLETELKEGFITIKGGHRVGLAGKVASVNNEVRGLQFITSFNIRIAQQRFDMAKPLLDYLQEKNCFRHTLLICPPKSCKTTLLRDLTRLISNGSKGHFGKKVAVIDERSEIAAAKDGIAEFDVGIRTDVMDSCPKAVGMMMMIRSMSPEIIVVDEIGKQEDVQALLDVFHAGVTIICTVHGSSLTDVKKRLSLQQLFSESIFNW